MVAPHLGALHATAMRLTRNGADAQDLVQESLLRAVRSLHLFEQGTNLGGWLTRILTNTFINHYRRTVRERRYVENTAQALDTPGLTPSAPQWMLDGQPAPRWDLGPQVGEALRQIPADFAAVVLMADLQDMAYREIAQTLDIPVGTVMSRLFRGRRLLQNLLRHHAESEGIVKPQRAPAALATVTALPAPRRERTAASA